MFAVVTPPLINVVHHKIIKSFVMHKIISELFLYKHLIINILLIYAYEIKEIINRCATYPMPLRFISTILATLPVLPFEPVILFLWLPCHKNHYS